MHIENDVQLDFSDVSIRPKRSTLSSRNEVNLFREIKMPYGQSNLRYIPIMNSNMATSGTFEIAKALLRAGCLATVHKYYNIQDWERFLNDIEVSSNIQNMFFPVGMNIDDLKIIEKLNKGRSPADTIQRIMIDVANGYTQAFVDHVARVREMFPSFTIAAGNVVTAEMTEALIIAGADIVKCGIGSGCLAGDTRILMANGMYKDIKDIKVHDRVINKNGDPVEVIGVKFSGYKKVYRYTNNLFYKDTLVTGCHKHWVGDYSLYSETGTSSRDPQSLIDSRRGNFGWSSLNDGFSQKVLTIPNKISFKDIPENFSISTSKFFMNKRSKNNLNTVLVSENITPSYNLGYVVGTFLGNGRSRIVRTIKSGQKPIRSKTSGSLTWYFGLKKMHIAKKLCDAVKEVFNYETKIFKTKNMIIVKVRSNLMARIFRSFYDSNNTKYLPTEWWCKNIEYLRGLLDGMVDSSGNYDNSSNITTFVNTSTNLIETYMVSFYMVYQYFPSVTKISNSGRSLRNVKEKNFRQRYEVSSAKNSSQNVVENLQINEICSSIEEEMVEIATYDIEVDCPTHSFIANNAIVHNSMCSTRIKAGVGIPQLSAVASCADAAHGMGGHIISDGGCIYVGDFGKALGAGADIVMSGSFFAGCDESGAEIITSEETGEKYCINYGMSSRTAQEKFGDGLKDYRTSEGRTAKIPYVGPVENVIKDILGGIRSTCTYVGAKNIKELPKRTTFVRVNNTHNRTFEHTTIGD